MKCVFTEAQKICKKFATHTCSDCKYQNLYCKKHIVVHCINNQHQALLIEGANLKHLKQKVKECISNIGQNTNSVIAEMNRSSVYAITQLKEINKNVKSLKKFTRKIYDRKRISFLIMQARDIGQKMDESPFEITEKLLALIQEKETLIASQNDDIQKLNTKIKELTDQMGTQAAARKNSAPSQGTN